MPDTTPTPPAEVDVAEIASFATLREANHARQIEWDKGNKISLSYRGNEMAGECGEACNVIKKLERERLGIRGSRATVDELASELADVIICADLIAMMEGIDLDAAIAAKFNATSEKVGLRTRYTPTAAEQVAGLRETILSAANICEHWADESRNGGWSTHQVEPNRRLAASLRKAALGAAP